MRLWDGTEISKTTVDRGLSEWDTMAGDLETRLSELAGKVKEALTTAPWGTGAEGRAFWQSHFQGDGPNRLIEQCTELSEAISAESGLVRTAVDNTLQVDAAIKEDLAAVMAV